MLKLIQNIIDQTLTPEVFNLKMSEMQGKKKKSNILHQGIICDECEATPI